MVRPAVLALVLAVSCAVPSLAQTFSDLLFDEDLYTFDAAPTGQYEATLTWEKWDEDDVLSLALLCENGSGELVRHALTLGSRRRASGFNVGIHGARRCFLGVLLVDGVLADYALSFSSTSEALLAELAEDAEPGVAEAMSDLADELRLFHGAGTQAASRVATKAPPTHTVLEQIQGGESRTYAFDVGDRGFLQLTAMWNRADTDLVTRLRCTAGETRVDFGFCNSGQERFLRFDADLFSGTSCTVTARSSETMVYALNFALYGGEPPPEPEPECTPRWQCCKICTSGRACGDTCIPLGNSCHQGDGCACNDYEVCP